MWLLIIRDTFCCMYYTFHMVNILAFIITVCKYCIDLTSVTWLFSDDALTSLPVE